jgi:hypothetical protein
MKARITWNGSSVEVHPELGLLVPGQALEIDLTLAQLDGLKADASGLFAVETPGDATPPRRAERARVPTVEPGGSPAAGQEA